MFRTYYTIAGTRKHTEPHTGDDLFAVMKAENASNIRVEGRNFVITAHGASYVASNIVRRRIPSKK